MSYPCSCCTDCVSVSVPGCPSGTCLRVASLVVNPTNSALPCGGSATVDIASESDLTACTTTVNWYLLSWDTDAFTSVSINSSGVLAFTTTTAITLNTFYTFVGKATCSDTLLSQYFTVKVAVKNICVDVVCAGETVCNPCTGACLDAAPDVELF